MCHHIINSAILFHIRSLLIYHVRDLDYHMMEDAHIYLCPPHVMLTMWSITLRFVFVCLGWKLLMEMEYIGNFLDNMKLSSNYENYVHGFIKHVCLATGTMNPSFVVPHRASWLPFSFECNNRWSWGHLPCWCQATGKDMKELLAQAQPVQYIPVGCNLQSYTHRQISRMGYNMKRAEPNTIKGGQPNTNPWPPDRYNEWGGAKRHQEHHVHYFVPQPASSAHDMSLLASPHQFHLLVRKYMQRSLWCLIA